jgi:hypothetical protein
MEGIDHEGSHEILSQYLFARTDKPEEKHSSGQLALALRIEAGTSTM